MTKVTHVIRSVASNMGGPARSVPQLCESLAEAQVEVNLATIDYRDSNDTLLLPDSEKVRSQVMPAWSRSLLGVQYCPRFESQLVQFLAESETDLVHEHGVWTQANRAAASASRRLKLPRVVSPRGMLTRWSLQYKSWKKQIAWRTYAQRDMMSATVLNATSELEANDLRTLGMRQPIAIVPIGLPVESLSGSRQKAEPREVLFLSRIHPKKGLTFLVEAWQRIAPKNWRVIIAGPDELDHRQELSQQIADAGLQSQFEFVGPAVGADKRKLLDRASLFVLPTHSENFGIVVPEALAAELPVITTRGTPWEGLLTHQCGWWIEIGTDPLVKALREAMALSDEERSEMGRRGRQFVLDEFSWPQIAQRTASVYDWILGGGSPPSCVATD